MENMEESADPFFVFPEEIWKVVLEHCTSTEDIQNVITAFPQLAPLSHGKQLSWFIADIIPLVFPKLVCFNTIKICRLVSKRWKSAVDKCLETYPDRLSYKSPNQACISETHFNYHPLPNLSTHLLRFLSNEHGNHSVIITNENPFPGRSVLVSLNYWWEDNDLHVISVLPDTYLDMVKWNRGRAETLALLETFGHHIWYITFYLPNLGHLNYSVCVSELVRILVNCLLRLPNLKSLKLKTCEKIKSTAIPNYLMGKIKDALGERSMIPANLESLDVSTFGTANIPKEVFNSFLKRLVSHEHITSLSISVDHWNRKIKKFFPNLTELSLKEELSRNIHCPDESEVGKPPHEDILESLLSFPHLRKLQITASTIRISHVLKIISTLQIESLVANATHYIACPCDETFGRGAPVSFSTMLSMLRRPPERPKDKQTQKECPACMDVPSIINLKLNTTSELYLGFVKRLPSLQYLTLNATSCFDAGTDGYHIFFRCMNHLCFGLSDEGDASFKVVWGGYPNLEMITVVHGDHTFQSVRETGNQVFMASSTDSSADGIQLRIN